MTPNEFDATVQRLELAFKKKYAAEAKPVMFRRLREFPVKAFSAAVEELILEERFLPPFSKIQEAMRRVSISRSWQTPQTQAPAPVYRCKTCEDSGIKLRRFRADIVRDFYCVCSAADALTRHDWTQDPWRQSIERPAKWVKRVSYELKTERPEAAAMVAQIFDDEAPF